MKEVTISHKELNSRGYEYIKEVFSFPEYFGNNLDALYDCLTDNPNIIVRFIYDEEENDLSRMIIKVIKLFCNKESMYIIE